MYTYEILCDNMIIGVHMDSDGSRTVSVVGSFPIKGDEIEVEKPKQEGKLPMYDGQSFTEDDYGPQKWCKDGEKLSPVYDTLDRVSYVHSDGYHCSSCEQKLRYNSDGKLELYQPLDNHFLKGKELSMDDLKETWDHVRKASDTKEWYHKHHEELKKLYSESADLAGKESDLLCAPVHTEGLCKLSHEEINLLGYVSSVVLYSPAKARLRVLNANPDKTRESIRTDLLETIEMVKESGLSHPSIKRYNLRKLYPNWTAIEKSMKEEEAFMRQDWALEARRHIMGVY